MISFLISSDRLKKSKTIRIFYRLVAPKLDCGDGNVSLKFWWCMALPCYTNRFLFAVACIPAPSIIKAVAVNKKFTLIDVLYFWSKDWMCVPRNLCKCLAINSLDLVQVVSCNDWKVGICRLQRHAYILQISYRKAHYYPGTPCYRAANLSIFC